MFRLINRLCLLTLVVAVCCYSVVSIHIIKPVKASVCFLPDDSECGEGEGGSTHDTGFWPGYEGGDDDDDGTRCDSSYDSMQSTNACGQRCVQCTDTSSRYSGLYKCPSNTCNCDGYNSFSSTNACGETCERCTIPGDDNYGRYKCPSTEGGCSGPCDGCIYTASDVAGFSSDRNKECEPCEGSDECQGKYRCYDVCGISPSGMEYGDTCPSDATDKRNHCETCMDTKSDDENCACDGCEGQGYNYTEEDCKATKDNESNTQYQGKEPGCNGKGGTWYKECCNPCDANYYSYTASNKPTGSEWTCTPCPNPCGETRYHCTSSCTGEVKADDEGCYHYDSPCTNEQGQTLYVKTPAVRDGFKIWNNGCCTLGCSGFGGTTTTLSGGVDVCDPGCGEGKLYKCKSNYHQVGDRCDQNCSENTCTAVTVPEHAHCKEGKKCQPKNTDCSNRGPEVCTEWECDASYHQDGNQCKQNCSDTCVKVEIPEHARCKEGKKCQPRNPDCSNKGPEVCTEWECIPGWHVSSGVCVEDCNLQTCNSKYNAPNPKSGDGWVSEPCTDCNGTHYYNHCDTGYNEQNGQCVAVPQSCGDVITAHKSEYDIRIGDMGSQKRGGFQGFHSNEFNTYGKYGAQGRDILCQFNNAKNGYELLYPHTRPYNYTDNTNLSKCIPLCYHDSSFYRNYDQNNADDDPLAGASSSFWRFYFRSGNDSNPIKIKHGNLKLYMDVSDDTCQGFVYNGEDEDAINMSSCMVIIDFKDKTITKNTSYVDFFSGWHTECEYGNAFNQVYPHEYDSVEGVPPSWNSWDTTTRPRAEDGSILEFSNSNNSSWNLKLSYNHATNCGFSYEISYGAESASGDVGADKKKNDVAVPYWKDASNGIIAVPLDKCGAEEFYITVNKDTFNANCVDAECEYYVRAVTCDGTFELLHKLSDIDNGKILQVGGKQTTSVDQASEWNDQMQKTYNDIGDGNLLLPEHCSYLGYSGWDDYVCSTKYNQCYVFWDGNYQALIHGSVSGTIKLSEISCAATVYKNRELQGQRMIKPNQLELFAGRNYATCEEFSQVFSTTNLCLNSLVDLCENVEVDVYVSKNSTGNYDIRVSSNNECINKYDLDGTLRFFCSNRDDANTYVMLADGYQKNNAIVDCNVVELWDIEFEGPSENGETIMVAYGGGEGAGTFTSAFDSESVVKGSLTVHIEESTFNGCEYPMEQVYNRLEGKCVCDTQHGFYPSAQACRDAAISQGLILVLNQNWLQKATDAVYEFAQCLMPATPAYAAEAGSTNTKIDAACYNECVDRNGPDLCSHYDNHGYDNLTCEQWWSMTFDQQRVHCLGKCSEEIGGSGGVALDPGLTITQYECIKNDEYGPCWYLEEAGSGGGCTKQPSDCASSAQYASGWTVDDSCTCQKKSCPNGAGVIGSSGSIEGVTASSGQCVKINAPATGDYSGNQQCYYYSLLTDSCTTGSLSVSCGTGYRRVKSGTSICGKQCYTCEQRDCCEDEDPCQLWTSHGQSRLNQIECTDMSCGSAMGPRISTIVSNHCSRLCVNNTCGTSEDEPNWNCVFPHKGVYLDPYSNEDAYVTMTCESYGTNYGLKCSITSHLNYRTCLDNAILVPYLVVCDSNVKKVIPLATGIGYNGEAQVMQANFVMNWGIGTYEEVNLPNGVIDRDTGQACYLYGTGASWASPGTETRQIPTN